MVQYCILGWGKFTDVRTLIFRWILPFWYFCFIFGYTASLDLYAKRKQKYQNGNIYRKLRVPTSERECKLSNPRAGAPRARCMEKIYGNLRKPARPRRARAMCWFSCGQVYSKYIRYHSCAAVPLKWEERRVHSCVHPSSGPTGCTYTLHVLNLVDLNIWIYCVAPIRYYLYYKSTYL